MIQGWWRGFGPLPRRSCLWDRQGGPVTSLPFVRSLGGQRTALTLPSTLLQEKGEGRGWRVRGVAVCLNSPLAGADAWTCYVLDPSAPAGTATGARGAYVGLTATTSASFLHLGGWKEPRKPVSHPQFLQKAHRVTWSPGVPVCCRSPSWSSLGTQGAGQVEGPGPTWS